LQASTSFVLALARCGRCTLTPAAAAALTGTYPGKPARQAVVPRLRCIMWVVAGVSEDLCFEFHNGHDLLTSDVLLVLQLVLAEVAPTMAAALEVLSYELDPERRRIDLGDPEALRAAVMAKGTERGALYQDLAASHGAPDTSRRFGHALLQGHDPKTAGFFLSADFDTMAPARPSGDQWLWSNSISGRISRPVVEGIARQEWLLRFTRRLAAQTDIVWGAGYHHAEFAATNLDTRHGIRALGRDVRQFLPGIYWLNVFGRPYRDLIGTARLLSAPAAAVEQTGSHVIIQAYPDAEDWAGNQASRDALRAALGAEHFYDRDHPHRTHRAPDFGLAELPPRPPLRVVTTDGTNFTQLR
jgi:hypothetical protein